MGQHLICYYYGDISFFCPSFCPGFSSGLLWIQRVPSEDILEVALVEGNFSTVCKTDHCIDVYKGVQRSSPSGEREEAEFKQRYSVSKGTEKWWFQHDSERLHSLRKPQCYGGRWGQVTGKSQNMKELVNKVRSLHFPLWIIGNPEED